MDSKNVITNFLSKMASQDNRATAAPYFYVIRTKVKRYVPDETGDDSDFVISGDVYESENDARAKLKEYGETPERIKKLLSEGKQYDYKMDWENKGMFLTETDAEKHLKANHYHYSSDAHTYIDHAWRAPELEQFFKALFTEFNIEPQNWGR
jgi:hypothetical protein